MSPDGIVHAIVRDTNGNVETGNFGLSYRSGYIPPVGDEEGGTWQKNFNFGSPENFNHVVGIAAPDNENVFLAHASGSNIKLYKVNENSDSELGSLNGWFGFPNDFQFRGWKGKVYLISSDNNNVYYSWANANATDFIAELNTNRKTHNAGSGLRGTPDLYVAKNGEVVITYGAGQKEVYMNKYDASGMKVFTSDKVIFTAPVNSTSVVNKYPYPVIAASDFGDVIVSVILHAERPCGTSSICGEERDGKTFTSTFAYYYWTYSTDGGETWSSATRLSGGTFGDATKPQEERQQVWSFEGSRKGSIAYNNGVFALIHFDQRWYWRGSFGMIDFREFTTDPDLGDDASLCAIGGSIELNSTIPSGKHAHEWFKDGVSLGESSMANTTLNVTEGGRYTVSVDDVTYDDIFISEGIPTPELSCCQEMAAGSGGNSIELDAGVSRPGMTYEWLLNGSHPGFPVDNTTKEIVLFFDGPYTLNITEPGCDPLSIDIDVYLPGETCSLSCDVDPCEGPECPCEGDDCEPVCEGDTCDVMAADIKSLAEVIAYPNPFVNSISVQSNLYSGEAEYALYNMSGKKILTDTFVFGEAIEFTNDLESGVYILSLMVKGETINLRISK